MKRRLFLIALFAADSARASDCFTRVLANARRQVQDQLMEWAREYPLDTLPEKISSAELREHDLQTQNILRRMGVETAPTSLPTFIRGEEVEVDGDFTGRILRVMRLPPPAKKATALTPALLHPEMKAAAQRLHDIGETLVVDTALPATQSSAAYRSSMPERLIAIQPETPWWVFVHEKHHSEFHSFVAPQFETLQKRIREGLELGPMFPAEAREYFTPQRVRRLEELLKKELPFRAVDETMAVDEQIRVLGFDLTSNESLLSIQYALKNQMAELRERGERFTLTDRELLSLAQALAHYTATQKLKDPARSVKEYGFGVTALGVASTKVFRYTRFNPEDYTSLYTDADGNLVGLTPEGHLVYSSKSEFGLEIDPKKTRNPPRGPLKRLKRLRAPSQEPSRASP